ncbi:MAG: ferritin family protein [Candidatus Omnitrophota bacterium]
MEKKKELLEEAIKLELNMSDLYLFYSNNFKEDREFWQQMAGEEKEHASLLEMAEDFLNFGSDINDIIYTNLDELKEVNKNIKDTIEKFKKNLPSKEDAYKYAIEQEESAYELHYQKLMTGNPGSKTIETLQELNVDDKNHAERISKLLTPK